MCIQGGICYWDLCIHIFSFNVVLVAYVNTNSILLMYHL